jgi:hypothetical protein
MNRELMADLTSKETLDIAMAYYTIKKTWLIPMRLRF